MRRGGRRRAERTASYRERPGLPDRLRAARRRRGLRQIDAAREIGVSRETLARIEVAHMPSDRTRAKVLRWLEAQEAAFAAEDAAAARAEGEARRAPGRERRAAVKRLRGARRGVRARLAVKRRARRAFRGAAAESGKPGTRRR